MSDVERTPASLTVRPLRYFHFLWISVSIYVGVTLLLQLAPVRPYTDGKLVNLGYLASWEAFQGELPKINDLPNPAAVEWRPLRELQSTPEGQANIQPFWIKITMPAKDNDWRDPQLWVKRQTRYDVYADGARIGGVDPRGADRFNHSGFGWRMWELPAHPQPQTLLVRIEPVRNGMFIGQYVLGEGTFILPEMLLADALPLAYVILFGLLGAVSLIYYLRAHRDPAYLYFSLITFSAAAGYWMRTNTVQLLPHSPLLVYFADLPGIIGTASFLMFLYYFMKDWKLRIFKWLAAAMCVHFLVCIPVGLTMNFIPYASFYRQGLLPLLIIGVIVSLYYIIRRFRAKADVEAFWMLTGMLSAILFIILHIGGGYITRVPDAFRFGATAVFSIVENAAGMGVLLFVLALGMVLISRISRIRLEHRQFTLSLERMVEERTIELEKANRLLQQSVRERAETAAEMSVLEERNRIARDIHDVVGHTLTTTLVQIEAAKRLLQKQEELGLRKLDMSVELVRKSLEDIRDSVHMMQSGEADYELEPSLHQLAARTEAAGVAIEGRISPLPHLSILQKKIVFHAFQEGLTNGMRHGQATRFAYELKHDGGHLCFTLWNNGKPAGDKPFGFGLSNMRDRIHQLGGSMEASSPDGEGFQLNIRFPVF